MPSEIRRYKFTVSWLCDDHTAADNLRVETFSTPRYDSPLSVWKRRTPLLYMFRLFGSPVSWVR
jgi:hypothetical protein